MSQALNIHKALFNPSPPNGEVSQRTYAEDNFSHAVTDG